MIFIMVVSSSLAQTKLGGEKVREKTYYTLRPKVFCKRETETFERSLEPSGQLGIYLQAKMTKTEASDLVFYLEHMSGVWRRTRRRGRMQYLQGLRLQQV